MTRSDAISSLRPNSEWTLIGEAELIWSDTKEDKPTDAEIDAEVIRLQAEIVRLEYARNRKEEYPPMEDQLDYMYHNGFEKWKTDMIDPVKDKYPKG
jgi:hypothetical protein|tara:strand:+ start:1208 stop:1498 length:291 start_codon:yes stop_codon:yes gene_type:complete